MQLHGENGDERIKTVDQVNYGEQVEKVQLFNSKGLALSKHYAFSYLQGLMRNHHYHYLLQDN